MNAIAAAAVTAATPEVDQALRIVATAWQHAGFAPDDLVHPWNADQAHYFRSRPDLIDAIDVIVRGGNAATAAA